MSDKKVTLQMFVPAREAQQYEVEVSESEWNQWIEAIGFGGREPDVGDVRYWMSSVEAIDPFREFYNQARFCVNGVRLEK